MSEFREGNTIKRDYYYSNPARLDLEVMRKKAFELSTQPDRQGQYSHVVIHHHDHSTPCITQAQAYFHEDFPAGGVKSED